MKVETKKLHDEDYLFTLHNFGGDEESKKKYDGLEVYVVKHPVVQSYADMYREYNGNIVIYEENNIEMEHLIELEQAGKIEHAEFKVVPRAYVKYTEYTDDMRFMYDSDNVDLNEVDFKSIHEGYSMFVTDVVIAPVKLFVGVCEVEHE